METSHAKVTGSGQVSLPAVLRRRWAAGSILVIDRGDYAIIRPVPADPITALQGVHAGSGPIADEVRETEREEEALAEQRRQAR